MKRITIEDNEEYLRQKSIDVDFVPYEDKD